MGTARLTYDLDLKASKNPQAVFTTTKAFNEITGMARAHVDLVRGSVITVEGKNENLKYLIAKKKYEQAGAKRAEAGLDRDDNPGKFTELDLAFKEARKEYEEAKKSNQLDPLLESSFKNFIQKYNQEILSQQSFLLMGAKGVILSDFQSGVLDIYKDKASDSIKATVSYKEVDFNYVTDPASEKKENYHIPGELKCHYGEKKEGIILERAEASNYLWRKITMNNNTQCTAAEIKLATAEEKLNRATPGKKTLAILSKELDIEKELGKIAPIQGKEAATFVKDLKSIMEKRKDQSMTEKTFKAFLKDASAAYAAIPAPAIAKKSKWSIKNLFGWKTDRASNDKISYSGQKHPGKDPAKKVKAEKKLFVDVSSQEEKRPTPSSSHLRGPR